MSAAESWLVLLASLLFLGLLVAVLEATWYLIDKWNDPGGDDT